MSDWRKASFRGVPFFVGEAPEYGGGRRDAEHDIYDGKGFAEDTGELLATHSIAAFVVGTDYAAQGAKLEKALNERGPGVLVHPTLGSLNVQIGNWTARVSFGRIDYTIPCKDSGVPLPPEEVPEPAVWKWTDSLRGTINGAFVAALSTANQAASVLTAAVNDVNTAAEAVLDAAQQFASPDIVGTMLSSVERLAGNADATVRLPSQLAGQWTELLEPLTRAGYQASLAGLSAVPAPVGSPTSPIAANRDAIASCVRGGLAAGACDALLASLPPTREAALVALADVSAAVKRVADESTDRDVWRSLMDARDATVRTANRLITRLPQTRTWVPQRVMSAFEASQALYGNGAQVDDILTRNGIVNPLWISDAIRVRAVA